MSKQYIPEHIIKLVDGSELRVSGKKLKIVREYLEDFAVFMEHTQYHDSMRMKFDFIEAWIEETCYSRNTVMNVSASAMRRVQNCYIKEHFEEINHGNRFKVWDLFISRLSLEGYIQLVRRASDLDVEFSDDVPKEYYQ